MKSEIFSGITIAVIGIIILLGGSMHGHFMPKSLGIFFICSGFLWVIYSIMFKKKLGNNIKKPEKNKQNFVICFKCRKPFFAANTNGYKCPDCGGKLENLDGFYDRHPELKEENKEKSKES